MGYATHYKDMHEVTIPYIKEMLTKNRTEDTSSRASDKGEKEQSPLSSLSFTILVGGFMPRDENIIQYLNMYPPDVDTIFISGENDELVPPAKTLALKSTFRNHQDDSKFCIFYHSGKHMVPTCTKITKEALRAFISKKIGFL